MRHNGLKRVYFSDGCVMECPRANYLKKQARKANHWWGTKSKFSGPFTEEELRRFNSVNGTGKW